MTENNPETKYIDLHMHTGYSDGITDPQTLVRTARLNELDIIALTDHDNLSGIPEAVEAGRQWGIQVIPGVEVSTTKYHILGLNIDYTNPQFKDFIAESANTQERITKLRTEVLRKYGIPVNFEKLREQFPESGLGKANLWMLMIKDPECKEYFRERRKKLNWEAYKEVLRKANANGIGDNQTSITPEIAIREIHSAGGLAFIAHPFKDIKQMQDLDALVAQGLDGLEVQPNFNGQNTPFKKYAASHNLLVTYGSDYHGGIFGRPMLERGRNTLSRNLERALGV